MAMTSGEKLITLVVAVAACCIGSSTSLPLNVEMQQRSAANNIRRNRKHLRRNVLHNENGSRSLLKQRRKLLSSMSVIDLDDDEGGNTSLEHQLGESMSFGGDFSSQTDSSDKDSTLSTASLTGREPTHSSSNATTTTEPTDHPGGTLEHPLAHDESMSFDGEFSLHHFDSSDSDIENSTVSSTIREPTPSPSNITTTSEPTVHPSSIKPTMSPSTHPTTANPSSHNPTSANPTTMPSPIPTSTRPTTMNPSSLSPTSKPSDEPSTLSPSMKPTTANPSHSPSTSPSIATLLTAAPSIKLTQEVTMNTEQINKVHPTIAPTTKSPVESSTTNAPTIGSFSSSVRIKFIGIAELMDNATVIVLENVTLSFLNEQFFGVLDVHEVNLVSQSVDHSSINATRKSRDVRVLNGRRLKTISKNGNDIGESMMRSLAESSSSQPSLIVLLNVDGAVSNWTPFDAAIDGQDIDDSISTVLAQDISSNYETFMTELAEDSEFFPSVTNQTPSSAVTDSRSSEANDNANQKIVIIFGAVAAFVALVGSKLYMERRSAGIKQRRRRSDVDGREESAYDLSRVMKSSEDNFGDESSPIVEKAKQDDEVATYDGGCVACLGPMNVKSPQKEKIDARLTSLLDQADSAESEPQQNEISALDMSPQLLKAAIKRKDNNIYVFTDNQAPSARKNGKFPDDGLIEIQRSVSSLSNPSHIEEPYTPSPRYGYLGDRFNHTNVEKLIGDQYDTRAIMTPFTPKGNGNSTPSRRMNYSFSSPTSTPRKSASNQDKLYYVYAPSGPLGTIIDTTPEGPMIHSLKPNSQLLGLVDPGDLIVGLDGVDTRNMTAATFTRLMAKRSQGERKITLLKGTTPLSPTPSSPR